MSRPLLQDSFAPFLYRTRTLLRPHVELAKTPVFANYTSIPLSNSKVSSHYEIIKRYRHTGRTQGTQSRPDPSNDGEQGIPFEGDRITPFDGSTMTPKEFHRFETLMRKKTKATSSITSPSERTSRSSSAYLAFPVPLQGLAKEAEESREMVPETDDETEATLPGPLNQYLVRAKEKLDMESTDAALWKILQSEVFDKVRVLQERLNSSKTQQLPKNDELSEVARSAPEVLVHFMKLMQANFQGSSLALALLPTLKKLGPSAFALTASTALYNEHMRVLYGQYTDLDAMAQILAEMDQEVYEFDSGTKNLLAFVLSHAQASRRGQNGPGQQAFWLTDYKTRSLAKLEHWSQIIGMRIAAAALRKAEERSMAFLED